MSKHRKKNKPSVWRVFWYQVVEGRRLLRWHTGSFSECFILYKVAAAVRESTWVSKLAAP